MARAKSPTGRTTPQAGKATGKVKTRRAPKQPGVMNATETRFSLYLDELLKSGEITEWGFERMTWKLATDTRYTPDFYVITRDGALQMHEVKAGTKNGKYWAEDDAKLKIKIASTMFGWVHWFIRYENPDRSQWMSQEFGA